MSTASRDASRRAQAGRRWRPKLTTWVVLIGVTLVVVLSMLLAAGVFGKWPPGGTEGEGVKPASPYAAGLAVEILGTPIVSSRQMTSTSQVGGTPTIMTDTVRTVTVTVKITNNVQQPPAVQGTPTPGAPTPLPQPARVFNASVKVLFYDKGAHEGGKRIVGSGVGNYYSKDGLAPGQSATFDVVAADVGEFANQGYEAFADGLLTDKDPIRPPEPTPGALVPSSAASR